jgi:hypothetical protein
VLDWIAMVTAWQLDYLVKIDVVELASFLPMDRVDRHDELAIMAPPIVLLRVWLGPCPCTCKRLPGQPPRPRHGLL